MFNALWFIVKYGSWLKASGAWLMAKKGASGQGPWTGTRATLIYWQLAMSCEPQANEP